MSTDIIETDANERDAGVIDSIREAIGGLSESASVDRVYGDPMTADGKTLVPVAQIAYGFGGGFGSGTGEDGAGAGEGGGGGGGVRATPVGVLEVSDGETRFVRFDDRRRLALAAGVGVVLGLLLGRRLS
jgi:uncharacterized spore protein YtfJ